MGASECPTPNDSKRHHNDPTMRTMHYVVKHPHCADKVKSAPTTEHLQGLLTTAARIACRNPLLEFPWMLTDKIKDLSGLRRTEQADKWEPATSDGWDGNPIHNTVVCTEPLRAGTKYREKATRGLLAYDHKQERFTITPNQDFPGPNQLPIHYALSSAELLYRLRAQFPEVTVHSPGPSGYKSVWSASLTHKNTGLRLALYDYKGCGGLRVGLPNHILSPWEVPDDPDGRISHFFAEVVELLNDIISAPNTPGECRLMRYAERHFILPPLGTEKEYFHEDPPLCVDRCNTDINAVSAAWISDGPPIDSPASLGKVDVGYDVHRGAATLSLSGPLEEGYAPLRTVISSPLVFYRLLCLFEIKTTPCIRHGDAVVGVWSVSLQHKRAGKKVVLFDLMGVPTVRFDAQPGADNHFIRDLLRLVEMLCSKLCPHPYDGCVAGTVA